ncbi:MAG: helix-turn-helix transcriptional regulator [Nevskiales bacterium]|nr:helix-turn-helix transcriptional regulator [Nevskiales bacterium]
MARKNEEGKTRAPVKPRKRRQDRPEALALLGRQLRTVRNAQGFTSQDAFAYSCGIDRAYYSALERGERNVGILKLMQIAVAMGVEVGELIPPIEELEPTLAEAKKRLKK